MARFKKTEWMYGVTKAQLTDMLKDHYKDFHIEDTGGWREEDIRHFLQLHHWLYPDTYPAQHHIRTCESIIMEVSNQ